MRVSTLMTRKPFTLQPSASLDEAMQLMEEHELRHLPLVEHERLVGIVSDRDLLRATGWLPARIREVYQDPGTDQRARTLRELAHTSVRTLSPDDTVVAAAVELVASKIGCLPVVEGGALVGILTETDIVRAFADACRGNAQRGLIDPPLIARMTRGARSITSNTPLSEALELMQAMDVRHLPVVQDERVIGIVSDRDLRRAHGSNRDPQTPVDEVMSHNVVTIDPEKPLSYAAELMLARRIGAVPVVDDDRLVGIITLTDLLDHCLESLRDPDVAAAVERAQG
jgi:CBS domain-containing protein